MADCSTLYGTSVKSVVASIVQTQTQTITQAGDAVTSITPIVATVCPPAGSNATDCSTSTSFQTVVQGGQASVYETLVINTVYTTQYQTSVEPTATQCDAITSQTSSSRPLQQTPVSLAPSRQTSSTDMAASTPASTATPITTSSESSTSSHTQNYSTHFTTSIVVVTDPQGSSTTSTQITQMLVPQSDIVNSAKHTTSLIVGSTIGALFGCLFVVGLALGLLKGVGPFKRLRRGYMDDSIDDMVWMPPDHDRDDDNEDVKVHPPQRTLSYRSHASSSYDNHSADLGRQPSTAAHTMRPMSQIAENSEWHHFSQRPVYDTQPIDFGRKRSWIGPLPAIPKSQPIGSLRPSSTASSFYGPDPADSGDILYSGMVEEPMSLPYLRSTSPELSEYYQRISRGYSMQFGHRPLSMQRQVSAPAGFPTRVATRPPSLRAPAFNKSSDSLSSASSSIGPPTPLLGGPDNALIEANEDSYQEEVGSPREIGKTFTLHVVGELASPDASPVKKDAEPSLTAERQALWL